MKRRIVGCGVVVTAGLVSYALAGLSTFPSSPSVSHAIPAMSPAQINFSLRNTGTSPVTIVASVDAPCTTVESITPPSAGNNTAIVGAGSEVEWAVLPPALVATTTCTVHLASGSGAPLDQTVQFVVGAGAPIDLEPSALDFGTRATNQPEQQLVSFYNYTGAMLTATAAIGNDATGSFSLTGGACTGSADTPGAIGKGTCDLTAIPANGSATLGVTCNPASGASGPLTAELDITGGATQSIPLTCNAQPTSGIAIQEQPLDMTGPVGTIAGTAHVIAQAGPGINVPLTSAALMGGDAASFSFVDPGCSGQACTWSPGMEVTPAALGIQCTNPMVTTLTTTLAVQGQTLADTAMTTVNCTGTAAGAPILVTNPSSLQFPPGQLVGEGSSQTLGVGNSSNAGMALTGVQATVANTTDYNLGGQCTSLPCGPFNAGSGADITVSFTPTFYGDRSTTITVNSTNGGQVPVQVSASGSGGQLINVGPTAVHFGTIAKNQPLSRAIAVQDDGNISLNPTLTLTQNPSNGPLGISANMIPLFALGSGSANVTCGSNAATGGQVSGSVQVTATGPGVFGNSDFPIAVDCTVVDTEVQIAEGAVDFGLVRSDAGPQFRNLTITNTGNTPANVSSIALSGTSAHVSLKQPVPTGTLGAGSSVIVEVDLDPSAAKGGDEDFEMENLTVDVAADGATLSAPVHQGVVHASSMVTPNPLDLGTACAGGMAGSGDVTLLNNGTAPIQVMNPVMDPPFNAQLTTPQTTLQPNQSAVTHVFPSAQAQSGMLMGNLTWGDTAHDASMPNVIPVTLDYITSGTALSPTQLSFPSTAIGQITSNETAIITNCDGAMHAIKIHAISATQGHAGAWHVTPAPDEVNPVTVAGKGTLGVLVQFAPLAPGHYQATLPIENLDDGTITNVQLSADATGNLDNDSFYACGCSTPDAPAEAWPIGLAFIVIVRRRSARR